ncbi:MAG: hypothetical protein WD875_13740 [Pirellulales bacterium]
MLTKTESPRGTNVEQRAAATTVFRKPSTPSSISASATTSQVNAAPQANAAAPLEWRVRKPKHAEAATATATATNAARPTAQASAVKQIQYEAEFEAQPAPTPDGGPILRAANDSVLLPTPSSSKPAAATPRVTPRGTPRQLTPANPGSLRTVQRGGDGELVARQPRRAEPLEDAPTAPGGPSPSVLPDETTTPSDPTDSIFRDAPPTSDTPAPPRDLPNDDPPAVNPPTPDTRRDDTPPGKFSPPEDTPLPAQGSDANMRKFLFGDDRPGSPQIGELDACEVTDIEVKNKRVVDIPVNISPPPPNPISTLSFDRAWKDVTGKTLLVGRPVSLDATSGEATFMTADGEKRIKFRDLSRAEQGFFAAMYPLPVECHLIDEPYRGRNWIASTYTWKASAACHKPLYFEEVHLERYGHSVGPILQPFVSSAHFFGTLPILPYKMGVNTPNECIYTLGYYRPGSCAPYLLDPLPISARGALFEAGAWVGGVAVIP